MTTIKVASLMPDMTAPRHLLKEVLNRPYPTTGAGLDAMGKTIEADTLALSTLEKFPKEKQLEAFEVLRRFIFDAMEKGFKVIE